MKKFLVLFASLLTLVATAAADNDTPIAVTQMPQAAQQFITKHFGNQQVAYAKMESDWSKSYEVGFVNGNKVDFDKKGNWTEVDCKHSILPEGIAPNPITKYVTTTYPDRTLTAIDRDAQGYEIKLDNGLELKFNKEFRLVEMDH